MASDELVILVDDNDMEIGFGGKADIHREGRLHRAFSVFIFDSQEQMLIQQRTISKYHSAGLWSNTCCGHPRPGEVIADAAHRRLQQEMGFDCELQRLFGFRYRTRVGNGLIEDEYDHVFVGHYDGIPMPDPAEVADWKWIGIANLSEALSDFPNRFTYWFRKVVDELLVQMGWGSIQCRR